MNPSAQEDAAPGCAGPMGSLTLRSYRNTGRRAACGPQRVPNVALREDTLRKPTKHSTDV